MNGREHRCSISPRRRLGSSRPRTVELGSGLSYPTASVCPRRFSGALWAGKVPVLLNPLLKPNELDFILREAAVDTVVVVGQTQPLVAGKVTTSILADDLIRPRNDPTPNLISAKLTEAAVLLYTSGTTGRPKGVPLSHDNLLSSARSLTSHLGLRTDDVFLGVLPLFHVFGLTGTMILPLLLGAEVTYARFTPERVALLVRQRHVTIFAGVPTMYRLLIRSRFPPEALRGLRLAVSGGDALPSGVRDEYREYFGQELLDGYGLTKTAAAVSLNTTEQNRPGTVGRPMPGVRGPHPGRRRGFTKTGGSR